MDFRNPCVDTSSDLVADQERCGARDHIRESREECFLADGSVWGDPKQSTQCGTFRSRPARTSLIFPQPPPESLNCSEVGLRTAAKDFENISGPL